jgi:predicted ABC-type ATPase
MSRGGQALPVSSVTDSYRESTKSLSEVLKRVDELIVYNNTAHRRSFRVDPTVHQRQFVQNRISNTGLGG